MKMFSACQKETTSFVLQVAFTVTLDVLANLKIIRKRS